MSGDTEDLGRFYAGLEACVLCYRWGQAREWIDHWRVKLSDKVVEAAIAKTQKHYSVWLAKSVKEKRTITSSCILWRAEPRLNQSASSEPQTLDELTTEVAKPVKHTGHYARIPAQVYRDRKMNNTAGRLVAYVAEMARGRPMVELYVSQIARDLGVSDRTVQRAQEVAVDKGLLIIVRVRHGRINSASEYHLDRKLKTPDRSDRRRRAVRLRGGDKNVTPRVRDDSHPSPPLTPTPGPAAPGRGIERRRARRATPTPDPSRHEREGSLASNPTIEAHHEAGQQWLAVAPGDTS